MKWTLTIKDIDLGDLIPAESELKPHDHPIESWAATVLSGLLNDLHVLKLSRLMEVQGEPDETLREALLQGLKLDIAVTNHLTRNMTVTRQEG